MPFLAMIAMFCAGMAAAVLLALNGNYFLAFVALLVTGNMKVRSKSTSKSSKSEDSDEIETIEKADEKHGDQAS